MQEQIIIHKESNSKTLTIIFTDSTLTNYYLSQDLIDKCEPQITKDLFKNSKEIILDKEEAKKLWNSLHLTYRFEHVVINTSKGKNFYD